MNVQPIASHDVGLQGGTLLLADRGQLGGVADEHHAAIPAVKDKLDEVVEQLSVGEGCVADGGRIGHHRRLVDDEQRVLRRVVIEVERALHRLLAVDAAVDGVRRVPGIKGKDLGGAPRGSEQHDFLLQRAQCAHQSRRQRGLARTCRASQNHQRLLVTVGHEPGEDLDGVFLLGGRCEAKGIPDAICQFVNDHGVQKYAFFSDNLGGVRIILYLCANKYLFNNQAKAIRNLK